MSGTGMIKHQGELRGRGEVGNASHQLSNSEMGLSEATQESEAELGLYLRSPDPAHVPSPTPCCPFELYHQ